jgi:hypothetical protein
MVALPGLPGVARYDGNLVEEFKDRGVEDRGEPDQAY